LQPRQLKRNIFGRIPETARRGKRWWRHWWKMAKIIRRRLRPRASTSKSRRFYFALLHFTLLNKTVLCTVIFTVGSALGQLMLRLSDQRINQRFWRSGKILLKPAALTFSWNISVYVIHSEASESCVWSVLKVKCRRIGVLLLLSLPCRDIDVLYNVLSSQFIRIGFCHAEPISLCADLFVCFCFILRMCCIIVSTVEWPWWDWSLILRTYLPSVLWHCWLGHFTRKNPSPIWPIQWLKCNGTQRNAVPPPPIYGSKRSPPRIVTMLVKGTQPQTGVQTWMYCSTTSNFAL